MSPSTSTSLPEFHFFSLAGISVSLGLFIAITLGYLVYQAIYNVFFHPLKRIPGPLLARMSGIPYALHIRSGTMVSWVQELHRRYGDAVRLAPEEISFISAETAWPDIYGFRTGKYKNTGSYLKDRSWYSKPINGVPSIILSDEASHSRMRRNLAHAFSDQALRDQETLLQQYVDLLISRFGEQADAGKDVDIMRWYNYATFDIISDLAFGEPLYCLRDSQYHLWVTLVFANIKAIGIVSTNAKYPLFALWDKLKNITKNTRSHHGNRVAFFELVKDKVQRRIDSEKDRPDFFSSILKNNESDGKGISRDEMDSNSIILLAAGSETTATTLSGTTYLLLRNPDTYNKLVHEIRSTFQTANDITIEAVNKLEYLIACLQEGLRYYPPVPTGFPRLVPQGGDHISGHYVSEGTAVYVSQHATNHSERNFTRPDEYLPERWLGGEEFADDNREAVNPFSFGPRNCVGKNLAYAEMRLTLAKILFNFDLTLTEPDFDWIGTQKVFSMWEKPALNVKLTPVQR